MSLAFTNLGVSAAPDINDSSNAASFASASWTPPSSGLLFVFGISREASSLNGPPTPSGNGLTWHEIETVTFQSGDFRLTLWAADLAGSTTGATTFDFGVDTQLNFDASFFYATGADLSGGVVAAFAQILSGSGSAVASGSVTLPNAAGSADNRCIAAFAMDKNETQTPRANWTEVDDLNGSGPTRGLATQFRPDAFEDTGSASWTTSGSWGGIVAEIKAVAAGGQTLDVGKVASGEAVRGVTLAQDGPDALSVGQIPSGEVVRGVTLSQDGPDVLALGKIPSGEAVYGVTLGVGASLTLEVGKIASGEAVRGVTLSQDGADTLLLGKIPSGESVYGITLAGGALALELGKIGSGESVHGITLSQSGPVALLLGRILSGEDVRGVTLAQDGPDLLLVGKVASAAVVRGIELSNTEAGRTILVLQADFEDGVRSAEFEAVSQNVPFEAGSGQAEYEGGVRVSEYSDGVKVVEF